jgi:hypothetical protein
MAQNGLPTGGQSPVAGALMAEVGVEVGMVVAGMVALPFTAMATATATRPTVPCMATMGLTGAGIGVTKKRATHG